MLALGQRLDPTVDLALTIAGHTLAQNGDPGAIESANLVKRIIAAPPPPWSGLIPETKGPSIRRVSDLNGALRTVAFVRENPLVLPLSIIGILALAFFAGRATAR